MKYTEKESSTLELKATLPKNDQIVKTIIGFSNHKGGKIIIGVEDDGTIVGIPENDIMTVQEYLTPCEISLPYN